MSEPIPDHIGPYQIIRLLGLGGMAQVYHARKHVEGVDLVVALKVPRQHVVLERAARARFLKEAHITARMGSHPNIVQVLDVGVDGELPYMALEYITGVDLGRLCKAMSKVGTRWPEPAILWVLASIVQGLRHAWGAEVEGRPLHVIHRDISPSNVLVTYEGQIKVTDFGISHMAGLDTSGSIRGKARYMPYEQLMGQASAASDLYAVGAIAWELIEGKPFRHDKPTENEMYLAMMEGELPAITRKDVSPRLVQLVTKLLHHHDEQRPQTPMDAWLELKACPGLNLVDPDPVRALVEEFLGQHRQSGYTAVQVRVHPELVATRAALAAVAGEQVADAARPGEVDPEPPPEATLKWPYENVASTGLVVPQAQYHRPAVVDHGNEVKLPRKRTITVAPPRFDKPRFDTPRFETSRRGSGALGLAGLGLLLGVGVAFGAMKLMIEPAPVTEARPAEPVRESEASVPASAAHDERPSTTLVRAPELVAETEHDTVPGGAAPLPEDAGSRRDPRSDPAPVEPKPKAVPRAKLHVRLDLAPELELRVGSKVRRITGSVTLPVPASTKELAVRTPGSTTWYTSKARLEPGREYLLRLHAKRVELIPLDERTR